MIKSVIVPNIKAEELNGKILEIKLGKASYWYLVVVFCLLFGGGYSVWMEHITEIKALLFIAFVLFLSASWLLRASVMMVNRTIISSSRDGLYLFLCGVFAYRYILIPYKFISKVSFCIYYNKYGSSGNIFIEYTSEDNFPNKMTIKYRDEDSNGFETAYEEIKSFFSANQFTTIFNKFDPYSENFPKSEAELKLLKMLKE